MDTKELLEVIRLQRHDFINHLQVISGFLQLNKIQQAREYIQEIAKDIDRLGKIWQIKVPEATAALLIAINQAAKGHVEITYSIQSNLEQCVLPGKELAWAIKEALAQAFACVATQKLENRWLKISLQETGDKYIFSIFLSHIRSETEERIKAIDRFLSGYGGQAGIGENALGREVFFFFPRTGR